MVAVLAAVVVDAPVVVDGVDVVGAVVDGVEVAALLHDATAMVDRTETVTTHRVCSFVIVRPVKPSQLTVHLARSSQRRRAQRAQPFRRRDGTAPVCRSALSGKSAQKTLKDQANDLEWVRSSVIFQ